MSGALAGPCVADSPAASATALLQFQGRPPCPASRATPYSHSPDPRALCPFFPSKHPPQPALRGGALTTIQRRSIVLNGPLKLVQGNFGTIARIPIFINNSTAAETFGTSRACGCTGSLAFKTRVSLGARVCRAGPCRAVPCRAVPCLHA
jgi:hypothetical protein